MSQKRRQFTRDEPAVPRRGAAALARWAGLVSVLMIAACASDRGATVDLRPAYRAAVPVAEVEMLRCDGVPTLICTCRRDGLAQEFAAPSAARFDHGYAALVAFRTAPENKTKPLAAAEAHAVSAIFSAIRDDVEQTCDYLREPE